MDIITEHKGGVLLRIRVKTGAKMPEVDLVEVQCDIVKVAVKEQPEKGKANKAVINLIANRLNCNPSCIQIKTGKTSRTKTLLIEGVSIDHIKSVFEL